MKKCFAFAIAAACVIGFSPYAHAATYTVSSAGPPDGTGNSGQNYGQSFTVNVPGDSPAFGSNPDSMFLNLYHQ